MNAYVLPYASEIRVVSEELKALMPTVLWPRLRVVPNAVDLARFQPVREVPKRGPWAFLGRLDDGKSRAAAQLIDWAPALGISAIHVVGTGAEADALQRHAAKAGVEVKLLGWRDDVAELLRDGYAGVAGMGRVVLEAAALGLPCVLAGYEQLHGLVTPERFASIAFSNFSGRGVPAIDDARALADELHRFGDDQRKALRAMIEASHDEARLVQENETLLAGARVVEDARPALLQLQGLFRRAAADETPWALDHGIAVGLERLTRRPGEVPGSRSAAQVAALVDANTRRAIAQEHQALAAQVAELRVAVTALSEQVAAIARQQAQTPLRVAWHLARQGIPAPLKRTVRPLTERLRGLLSP